MLKNVFRFQEIDFPTLMSFPLNQMGPISCELTKLTYIYIYVCVRVCGELYFLQQSF